MDYSGITKNCWLGLLAVLTACTSTPKKTDNKEQKGPTATRTAEAVPENMGWVPGGSFMMGTENPECRDGGGVHPVRINGFWMDPREVTNAQCAEYVKENGYVTVGAREVDGQRTRRNSSN